MSTGPKDKIWRPSFKMFTDLKIWNFHVPKKLERKNSKSFLTKLAGSVIKSVWPEPHENGPHDKQNDSFKFMNKGRFE